MPLRVPKSEVSLTIATDSLRSLPPGASYSDRNGQASVKVSRLAATPTEPEYLYVYASCDSLELQCERYERSIRTLHHDYADLLSEACRSFAATASQHSEQKEKPPNGVLTALKWYFYGLLSGIILSVVFIVNLKRKN